MENDKVVFISSSYNPDDWNLKDILSIRTYLQSKLNDYDLDLLRVKILEPFEWLNDDALDAFVGIVRDNSDIEKESVVYINHPVSVYPAQTSHTAMILGGQCTKHWRLAYYNGLSVAVYDTIPNYTGGKLVKKELDYILKRFPHLSEKDVNFIKIKSKQPDSNSCGIYAAGLLTYLTTNGDPSQVSLSRDIHIMRSHFLKIIECRKLSLFPITNA